MKNFLDIVVPTHNRFELLQNSISFLINEANQVGAQISFYDNASSDGTEHFLKNFANKGLIRYYRSYKNVGCDMNMLNSLRNINSHSLVSG
jgi:GT2 family glycosyltransferase